MKVKSRFYNEIIKIDQTDEYLVYNLVNSGLVVLDSEVGSFLLERSGGDNFNIDESEIFFEVLQGLFDEGFLVESDIDEKALQMQRYSLEESKKSSNTSHIGLTIGTTILCNMGCPYCFQTVRPNKTLRDEKVINGIFTFVQGMINDAPVEKWDGISVTWFGGEPLINKEGIKKLTDGLIDICSRYDIPYDASIVTNGILLDNDTWEFLKQNRVDSVQVTIDGAKEIHDVYRPLKTPNSKNYEKILENLAMMPKDLSLVIRINTDKRVAASLEQLLVDLEKYEIWPQRAESVSLTLAWLKAYKGADVSKMINLTNEGFFEAENSFAQLKVTKFNEWVMKNNKPFSKIKWRTPERQGDCATWVSPYFFTIDPEGGVHKCWETLHDKDQSAGKTVGDGWKAKDYEKYTSYSRTTIHPVCYNCKFNPVCEGLSCAHDVVNNMKDDEFPCTPWKTKLQAYFKDMYLKMNENPETISFQRSQSNKNLTHANK